MSKAAQCVLTCLADTTDWFHVKPYACHFLTDTPRVIELASGPLTKGFWGTSFWPSHVQLRCFAKTPVSPNTKWMRIRLYQTIASYELIGSHSFLPPPPLRLAVWDRDAPHEHLMSLSALRSWDSEVIPRLQFKFNWEKKKAERFLKKCFPTQAKQHPPLLKETSLWDTEGPQKLVC